MESGNIYSTFTKSYEETVTDSDIPSAPVREGYTFTGWNTIQSGQALLEDLDVVACWNVNEYPMYILIEKGNGMSDLWDIPYGDALADSMPEDPDNIEGYEFTGWKYYKADQYGDPTQEEYTGGTMPAFAIVAVGEMESTCAKLVPADESSTAVIERTDEEGFAAVETYNSGILDGSDPLPYAVYSKRAPNDEIYGEYRHYDENSVEYDSWFVYGLKEYTTPEQLNEFIKVSHGGHYELSGNIGEYVGTGTIIKVYDRNNRFVEQFRVVIYGDLDNSGSATSSDTNIAIFESKKPSWSKGTDDENIPYLFRAANIDQSPSFSSSDANLMIMCNKNKAYIDQTTGLAHT
jgi:hypothetical protein